MVASGSIIACLYVRTRNSVKIIPGIHQKTKLCFHWSKEELLPFYAAACFKIFTTSNAYRYILSILKRHNLRSLRVLLRFKGYLLLTTRIHWIHLYVYFFKKHATVIKTFLVLLQWKQGLSYAMLWKPSIITRISGPGFCNYGEAEMILFQKTEILDVPNVEKDNTSEREKGAESLKCLVTYKNFLTVDCWSRKLLPICLLHFSD